MRRVLRVRRAPEGVFDSVQAESLLAAVVFKELVDPIRCCVALINGCYVGAPYTDGRVQGLVFSNNRHMQILHAWGCQHNGLGTSSKWSVSELSRLAVMHLQSTHCWVLNIGKQLWRYERQSIVFSLRDKVAVFIRKHPRAVVLDALFRDLD